MTEESKNAKLFVGNLTYKVLSLIYLLLPLLVGDLRRSQQRIQGLWGYLRHQGYRQGAPCLRLRGIQ